MRHAHDSQRQLLQMLQLRRHFGLQLGREADRTKPFQQEVNETVGSVGAGLRPALFFVPSFGAERRISPSIENAYAHTVGAARQTATITPRLCPPPAASTES